MIWADIRYKIPKILTFRAHHRTSGSYAFSFPRFYASSATDLDAVSIVDQAVENTVGQCRIAELCCPALLRAYGSHSDEAEYDSGSA